MLFFFVACAAYLRDVEFVRNGLMMGSALTFALMIATLLCSSLAFRRAFAKPPDPFEQLDSEMRFHKIFFKENSSENSSENAWKRRYEYNILKYDLI